MCGRFVRNSSVEAITQAFEVEQVDSGLQASYNVAPQQDVLAVIDDREGTRRLVQFRWGLVPFWAKDPAIGDRMINARAETVAQKRSFKDAFQRRRCLVVADGFYEWRKEEKGKTPVYIHLKSGEPFGLAGLFERWTSPEGHKLSTCTIITTEPNELLLPIHNRMPVIVPRNKYALWLDRSLQDDSLLLPILRPYAAEEMDAYAVSRLVNSPQNNSPACIEPLGLRPTAPE